ncbi:MAG: hypothetical protein DHS20C10_00240 [marine bacterium B5-7]|nr:MAG: hypothetical protein DHS20C10_00240 [marine bacterium B5-7]
MGHDATKKQKKQVRLRKLEHYAKEGGEPNLEPIGLPLKTLRELIDKHYSASARRSHSSSNPLLASAKLYQDWSAKGELELLAFILLYHPDNHDSQKSFLEKCQELVLQDIQTCILALEADPNTNTSLAKQISGIKSLYNDHDGISACYEYLSKLQGRKIYWTFSGGADKEAASRALVSSIHTKLGLNEEVTTAESTSLAELTPLSDVARHWRYLLRWVKKLDKNLDALWTTGLLQESVQKRIVPWRNQLHEMLDEMHGCLLELKYNALSVLRPMLEESVEALGLKPEQPFQKDLKRLSSDASKFYVAYIKAKRIHQQYLSKKAELASCQDTSKRDISYPATDLQIEELECALQRDEYKNSEKQLLLAKIDLLPYAEQCLAFEKSRTRVTKISFSSKDNAWEKIEKSLKAITAKKLIIDVLNLDATTMPDRKQYLDKICRGIENGSHVIGEAIRWVIENSPCVLDDARLTHYAEYIYGGRAAACLGAEIHWPASFDPASSINFIKLNLQHAMKLREKVLLDSALAVSLADQSCLYHQLNEMEAPEGDDLFYRNQAKIEPKVLALEDVSAQIKVLSTTIESHTKLALKWQLQYVRQRRMQLGQQHQSDDQTLRQTPAQQETSEEQRLPSQEEAHEQTQQTSMPMLEQQQQQQQQEETPEQTQYKQRLQSLLQAGLKSLRKYITSRDYYDENGSLTWLGFWKGAWLRNTILTKAKLKLAKSAVGTLTSLSEGDTAETLAKTIHNTFEDLSTKHTTLEHDGPEDSSEHNLTGCWAFWSAKRCGAKPYHRASFFATSHLGRLTAENLKQARANMPQDTTTAPYTPTG